MILDSRGRIRTSESVPHFVLWKSKYPTDWLMYPLNGILTTMSAANLQLFEPPKDRINWNLGQYFSEIFNAKTTSIINPEPLIEILGEALEIQEMLKKIKSDNHTLFDFGFMKLIDESIPDIDIFPGLLKTETIKQCKKCEAPSSEQQSLETEAINLHLGAGGQNFCNIQELIRDYMEKKENVRCQNCEAMLTKRSSCEVTGHGKCLVICIRRDSSGSDVPKLTRRQKARFEAKVQINETINFKNTLGEICYFDIAGGIKEAEDGHLILTFKTGKTYCNLLNNNSFKFLQSGLEELESAKILFYKRNLTLTGKSSLQKFDFLLDCSLLHIRVFHHYIGNIALLIGNVCLCVCPVHISPNPLDPL